MSSCADFFFTFCPKDWSASATSASSPTEDGKPPSHAAASRSALLRAQIAPKQQTSCVVPPAPAPCWSSNGSRALNFTSGQTLASLPHRGAALTAHKTAIAYDVSTPVARWHARTCKALLGPQAVQAPCIRHSLIPCRAQFCPLTGLPQLRCFNLPLQWPRSDSRRH